MTKDRRIDLIMAYAMQLAQDPRKSLEPLEAVKKVKLALAEAEKK